MLDALKSKLELDNLPCPGYASHKERLRVWIQLTRGTLVSWCPDPARAHIEYGVVDCESITKPGYYFIRSEGNLLHCVNWKLLMPTKKKA